MTDTASGPQLRRWAPVAVIVSVLSIVALVVYFQLRRDVDILDSLAAMDATVLPAALGLHLAMHALWGTRTSILAGGLGIRLPLVRAWMLVTAGQFGGAVTPGRVGAEGLKLGALLRWQVPGTQATRLVLADRFVDMVFFLTLGTLGGAFLTTVFGPEAAVLRALCFIAVAGLLSFFLLLMAGLARPEPVSRGLGGAWDKLRRMVRRPTADSSAPRVAHFLADVRTGLLALLRENPLRVAAAIALSVALWACEYGVLWLVLQGLGHDVSYPVVFAAGVLLTLLAPIPISPGGAGVVEVAALAMFASLTTGLTPAFVLIWRALTYYYDVLVGGALAGPVLRLQRLETRAEPA